MMIFNYNFMSILLYFILFITFATSFFINFFVAPNQSFFDSNTLTLGLRFTHNFYIDLILFINSWNSWFANKIVFYYYYYY